MSIKVKRALISVSDKSGIVNFAKFLADNNVEILSTGGTAKELEKNGIKVKEVSDYTGFPEMMDGRVKTLHPKIHGGLLCLRDNKNHTKQAEENNIEMIDIVIVNLYPFAETIAKKDCKFEDAIENIDIGGPSMLRSAAKNFKDVIVITDPEDYAIVKEALEKDGDLDFENRKSLAKKVFEKTAIYDGMINDYLNTQTENSEEFPDNIVLAYKKQQSLRYGENPHQKAAFYRDIKQIEPSITTASQLHGKELSYNNIMDTDGALEIVKEFSEPTASVIKHANPSGAAINEKIETALENAYDADPLSAFGCIIALNRPCNLKCAEFMRKKFIEVVIAPSYDKDALNLLMEKKNLRILELKGLEEFCKDRNKPNHPIEKLTTKKVVGGLLTQTRDFPNLENIELKPVTETLPTDQQIKDLIFAAKICKHVKSNSVLFAKDGCTVGIGAGQMSRVDSSMIAARKAGEKAKGAVMASDAFFPFRDGIDEAAKVGISAVIQPGGSIRDEEVIQAANEHKMAMVFSGIRLFLH
ncbi:bifunctional phosphoribosylaminoimidazolecarboxamide formyltransferase/IMP cyclohydrolase [Nanoarchaeota archaeon]